MKASAKHLLPKLDRSCAAPKGALPCAPCRERVARRILLEVAPVLSGVKPAALLSLEDGECGAAGRAERVFCSRRSRLAAATGLSVRVLRRTGRGCQALFFDAGLLAARLAEPDAAAFLRARGWPAEPPAALARLADAFADAPGDCPPEVGVFLGYPVRDVAGFIERPEEALPTRGTLWRVFAPAAESLRLMARIRRARDRALHLLALESDALRAVAMLRRLPSAAV